MSDAELIAMARLAQRDERMSTGALYGNLADRIEALIAERNDWESHAIYNAEFVDLAVSYRNERDAARAELAKAVEELELQEEEACMMENSYLELKKERDALEAKLAKAVEALENVHRFGVITHPALATLAEIKGESHD